MVIKAIHLLTSLLGKEFRSKMVAVQCAYCYPHYYSIFIVGPIICVLPLVQNRCKTKSCFSFVLTSSEPSPKIEVRIGVENMVMMANKTATPAVMK